MGRGGGAGRWLPRRKGGPHAASLSTFLENVFDTRHPSSWGGGDNADPSLAPTYLPWERGGEPWAVGVREA